MRDRIRPPAEYDKLLSALKETQEIFATKQKGMMFAASFGYTLHKGKDAPRSTGEGIRLEYFRSVDDEGFIDALAVAEADDFEVLSEGRREERNEIFERYAYLGLKELDQRFKAENRDRLDVIIDILKEWGGPAARERAKRLAGLV